MTVALGKVASTVMRIRKLPWIATVDTDVTHAGPAGLSMYSGTTTVRAPFLGAASVATRLWPFVRDAGGPSMHVERLVASLFRRSSDFLPWGISDAHADAVASTFGDSGQGVKIAIIDGGIDCSHPDLNIAGGQDWTPDSLGDCHDQIQQVLGGTIYGHGTLVAGVIGAAINNYGVRGMAPGASLYSLRVCDSLCPNPSIASALQWSITNHMQARYNEYLGRHVTCGSSCVGSGGAND